MRDTARSGAWPGDRDALGEVDPAGSRGTGSTSFGVGPGENAPEGSHRCLAAFRRASIYRRGTMLRRPAERRLPQRYSANFPDIDQCLWMAESFYNRPPARSEAPSQKGFTARLSTECRLSTASDGVPDGLACPATIHRSDDERLSTSQDGHEAPGPCTECLPLPCSCTKIKGNFLWDGRFISDFSCRFGMGQSLTALDGVGERMNHCALSPVGSDSPVGATPDFHKN